MAQAASPWDEVGKKKAPASAWDAVGKKSEPAASASAWDAVGAKPEKQQRPTGLALLAPPASMGYTKEEATETVRRAQAAVKPTGMKRGQPVENAGPSKAPRKPRAPVPADKTFLAPTRYTQEEIDAPPLEQLKAGTKAGAAAVSGMVAPIVNRAGAGLYPVRDFLNVLAEEHGKVADKYQGPIPLGAQKDLVLRALRRARPWESFKKGLVKGESTEFEAFQRLAAHDKAFRQRLKSLHLSPAVLDFIASVPIDAISGLAQGKVVGLLEKGAAKAQLGQKLEAKIPALGRLAERRRGFGAVQETHARNQAVAETHVREAADIAKDVEKTTNAVEKAGGQVRSVDPLTKTPVNEVARLAADYVEAGAKGARHALPKPVRPSIAELGLGPKAAAGVREGAAEAGAFTERVLESARTAGRGKLAELEGVAGKAAAKVKGKPLPPAERKALLAQVEASAQTKGREALERAVQEGELRTAVAGVQGEAGRAAGALRERLAPVNAQNRLRASAQTAGKRRVDELAQGTAPTERQVPIWGERAAAEARRAEELPRVRAEAEALRIPYGEVERLGERYRALADRMGQEMADLGIVSREAYETLRGQYLPRLYMLSSSSPKEARRWLDALEAEGKITAEAASHLRGRLLGGRGGRGVGPEDFRKHREIEEFSERISPEAGRIASPEATPAFSRYAASASREIGEARAWQELADNRPDLMIRGADVNAGTAQVPAGWSYSKELDAHIHPGVQDFITTREQVRKWATDLGPQWYRTTQRSLRRWWISSPRTAVNNAVGNFALGKSAAELNGARYSVGGYGQALKEYRAFRKSGKASPLMQEALGTDILSEGSSALPKGSRQVGAGFGVETPLERLKAAPGELLKFEHPIQEAYSQAVYQDVEKAGRFYLYKELRAAGKTSQEARDIVQAAMIDYSNIGPLLAFADRHNIFPFATFPTKAVFQYLNMAARRPDLFQTFTGERLRDLADQMADEMNPKAGAREKRRRGDVSLMEFPLPGQMDASGAQRYTRAPLLAPVLQMMPSNPDADVVSDRIKGMAPLLRVPMELAQNRSVYTGREIIPPGLPVGNEGLGQPGFGMGSLRWGNEGLGGQVMHGLKAIFPFASDAETAYHAATGTQPYPSPFASVPRGQDAVTRFLLGVAEKEGAGEGSIAGKERAAERMTSPEHAPYIAYANTLLDGLESGKVPINPALLQGARNKYTKMHEAKKALDEARFRLKTLLTTTNKTGGHRERAIEAQAHYVFALAEVVNGLAEAERPAP